MYSGMELDRVSSLSADQVDDLVDLYRNEWWSRDRRREDVERMLRETDEVIAFAEAETGGLVAFARVLTDYVYRAVLFDVIVDEHLRGEAVGEKLVEAVVNHPELRGVEHLDLLCLDEMQGFYEKHGFERQDDLNIMRREPSRHGKRFS